VPLLDGHGLSVGVMQSNDDFTVGGSISVNCHGWQHGKPPIASTVESFRLMRADGSIIRCSRTENGEWFAAALGGYGLFGIILDVELRVVPNERYRTVFEVLAVERFVAEYLRRVHDGRTGMAMGRLSVVPGDATYHREASLVTFVRDPCPADQVPPLGTVPYASLRRQVYRAQIDSPQGKQFRWQAEKSFGSKMTDRLVSRNQLLHEGSEVFRERNRDRTDILHEYFVPPDRFEEFVTQLRVVVPRHGGDLLNVTVRHLIPDDDSDLRYADREMLSLVLLFNMPRTAAADAAMERMTHELIEAALANNGRYYLPYRLHATPEQFERAYPQARSFFELKRRLDPEERFQNGFYVKYGGGNADASPQTAAAESGK
jgi:FAD/FMN-containing dehydrogenase